MIEVKKQSKSGQGVADPASFLKNNRECASRSPYTFETIKRMIRADGTLDLHAKGIMQLQVSTFPANEEAGSSLVDQIYQQQKLERSKQQQMCLNKLVKALQKYLPQVFVLNLSKNQVQEIDRAFCQAFSQLRVLDLSFNRISNLSDDIGSLNNLSTLKLDGNKLKSLPASIYDLSQLRNFSVKVNRLSELSGNIKKLKQLRDLDISINRVESLPPELAHLPKLTSLNISHNHFASLPCKLSELKGSLESISLEWFKYAIPPKPQEITTATTHGRATFQGLWALLELIQKYNMQDCALITFLENFSSQTFDKDFRDNRQRTILHQAAANGDTGVVNGLLMDKIDMDALDKDQCTPLCLAIRQENYLTAESLINSGADVNMGGGIFGSPLHLSIARLNYNIVEILINQGANLNIRDQYGNSPIHLIMNIFSKNPKNCNIILDKLLRKGARVNVLNDDQWAPVHLAVRKGQDQAIRAILDWNARVQRTSNSTPPLMIGNGRSSRNYRTKSNKQNLLHTFDLNIQGGSKMWSCIHLAALSDQYKIIKKICEAGADIFQRNSENMDARHCSRGKFIMTKTVQHLMQWSLRKKFDDNQIDSYKLNLYMFERFQKQNHSPQKLNEMLAFFKQQFYHSQGRMRVKDLKLLNELAEVFKYQDFTSELTEYRRLNKKPLLHIQLSSPTLQMKTCIDSMSDQEIILDSQMSPRQTMTDASNLNDQNEKQEQPAEGANSTVISQNQGMSQSNFQGEIRITVVKYGQQQDQMDRNNMNGLNSAFPQSQNQLISPRVGEENIEDCIVPRTQRPKSMQQTITGRHPKRFGAKQYKNDDALMELLRYKECLLSQDGTNTSKRSSQNENCKIAGRWWETFGKGSRTIGVVEETAKLQALIQLKQQANRPIFVQVMRSLFTTRDFYKIKNTNIQEDLIDTIARIGIVDLIDCLVKFQRDNEYKQLLDFSVSDRLDQCIVDLDVIYQKIIKKRKNHAAMLPQSPKGIKKAKSTKMLVKPQQYRSDQRNQEIDAMLQQRANRPHQSKSQLGIIHTAAFHEGRNPYYQETAMKGPKAAAAFRPQVSPFTHASEIKSKSKSCSRQGEHQTRVQPKMGKGSPIVQMNKYSSLEHQSLKNSCNRAVQSNRIVDVIQRNRQECFSDNTELPLDGQSSTILIQNNKVQRASLSDHSQTDQFPPQNQKYQAHSQRISAFNNPSTWFNDRNNKNSTGGTNKASAIVDGHYTSSGKYPFEAETSSLDNQTSSLANQNQLGRGVNLSCTQRKSGCFLPNYAPLSPVSKAETHDNQQQQVADGATLNDQRHRKYAQTSSSTSFLFGGRQKLAQNLGNILSSQDHHESNQFHQNSSSSRFGGGMLRQNTVKATLIVQNNVQERRMINNDSSNNSNSDHINFRGAKPQIYPQQMIDCVPHSQPPRPVINRVVDDQTPASPCSMTPRSIQGPREGAPPAQASISGFQTNSMYKPVAKTNIQQSPFLSINSDFDYDQERVQDFNSVTHVREVAHPNNRLSSQIGGPDYQTVQAGKGEDERDATMAQMNKIRNKKKAVTQKQSVFSSPASPEKKKMLYDEFDLGSADQEEEEEMRGSQEVDEAYDFEDNHTVRDNYSKAPRVKKTFWSPVLSTSVKQGPGPGSIGKNDKAAEIFQVAEPTVPSKMSMSTQQNAAPYQSKQKGHQLAQNSVNDVVRSKQSHSILQNTGDKMRQQMNKIESFKSLKHQNQQSGSSTKNQADHRRKSELSKKHGGQQQQQLVVKNSRVHQAQLQKNQYNPQSELNTPRRKEQLLAAHLQSYKNLNRQYTQHQQQLLQSSTSQANNSGISYTNKNTTSKKRYPLKQYQQQHAPLPSSATQYTYKSPQPDSKYRTIIPHANATISRYHEQPSQSSGSALNKQSRASHGKLLNPAAASPFADNYQVKMAHIDLRQFASKPVLRQQSQQREQRAVQGQGQGARVQQKQGQLNTNITSTTSLHTGIVNLDRLRGAVSTQNHASRPPGTFSPPHAQTSSSKQSLLFPDFSIREKTIERGGAGAAASGSQKGIGSGRNWSGVQRGRKVAQK